MWLVTNFEDIFTVDVFEAIECGLQVVDRLSHITVGREYQCL
jgi:hypothetical protein